MRNAMRISLWGWLLVAALALGIAASPGCRRTPLNDGNDAGGAGVIVGVGGVGGGGPGGGGGGSTGTGTGGVPAACAGPSDARLVVAGQRILRLTMNETLNTVRYLFGDAVAASLASGGFIGMPDDSKDVNRRFPPLTGLSEADITSTSLPQLEQIADWVASYVSDNFATVSACPAATDACATAYLDRLAPRAYRRRLTSDEQSRFAAFYAKLRAPQTVQGYEVTFTVEEATSYAVRALLGSPQMLWRWELGDPAMAVDPAGIPLTDDELATQLAFFLTDRPPDDTLLAAARAGTLRANLAGHVDALLASPAAHDWLRGIVETYLQLNTLPQWLPLGAGKFPFFTPQLVADLGTESRMFLDDALWNGNLTDLLLSRRAFLNSNLATTIYMVPVPTGATATTFVQTTLPADKRAGLLTNAALLTTRSRVQATNLVVPRGLLVAVTLLCMPHPGPDPFEILSPGFEAQSSRQQVETRAAQSSCKDCHAQFDPYGLALDNYDDFGRYRTIDDGGRPIDARTTLPAAIGGGTVANGVELAETLAASPAFTTCMANVLLRYAMVDPATSVELLSRQQAGCAITDVVQRYQGGSGKTFTDLVRATASAPAFVLRRAAP
jgi:Protein of unknown function (DUF1592)/Protein of unknown function (DUF1588)/Protein of unknown function (DUF1595)